MSSFEPSSACVNNLLVWLDSLKSIYINQFSLSDQATRVNLYAPTYGSEYASLADCRMAHHHIDMFQLEEVSVARFDWYWQVSRVIDYVKIDVEGHKILVLKDLESLSLESSLCSSSSVVLA